MQLQELHTRCVTGHGPQSALRLPGGFVVVRSTTPLLPLLHGLLFYEGDPNDGAALAAQPGARAALLLRGRDGATWRLVRELPGGCGLARLDAAAQRWVPVTNDALELGPFLRAQLGLPSRKLFEGLWSLSPDRLASRVHLPAAAASPAPAAPLAAPVPVDPAELRRTIERLERELEAGRQVDELQRRLDGLLYEQGQTQRARDGLRVAGERLESARAALRRFEPLGDLPDDPAALLVSSRRADEERAEAERRIELDREGVVARAAGEAVPPWRDPRFLGAAGVGLAALVAALATPWKVLALLDIPAFGVAAVLGLRWVGHLQAVDGVERFEAVFAERRRKVAAQWEAATAPLREAMGRAGADRPEALVEQLAARAAARVQLREAEAAFAAVRASAGEAAGRHEAIEREARGLEAELAQLGAGAYRPRAAIEAELAAARAELAGEAPQARAAALPLGGGLPGALSLAGDPGGAFGAPGGAAAPAREAAPADPCIRLLDHAAEQLVIDRHELGGRVAGRVGQWLASLSDRRWEAVELSAVAGLRARGTEGTVPFAALGDRDRDLAWLALQFSLVEQVAARQAIPLIYDDPFSGWDEASQGRIAQMLRLLGQRTQVVLRTSSTACAAHADAVVEAA